MPGSNPNPGQLHGFLIVDKPASWTSHDVVVRARRLLNERQIGHGGTLDPAATGVLPLAVGSATRVVEYMIDADKQYMAEIVLGVSTDSHDADGTVSAIGDASAVDRHTLTSTLNEFHGVLQQLPPMHAAIKVNGRRLYEAARRGIDVERQPRQIVVQRIELVEWDAPVATILVDCSKGTYVRAIARDLGDRLGCGAHLGNLVRLKTGPFSLLDAWSLHELESLDVRTEWPNIAVHPDIATSFHPAIVLDHEFMTRWRNGSKIRVGNTTEEIVRVYDDQGDWLGIGRGSVDEGTWRPMKVIGTAT